MITANQLRAARALLNIDQRQTAELAGLSVPTIQRMEASDGVIRANVDSLMKLVSALENAGIELINPQAPSATGGRGVRLREHVAKPKPVRQPKASTSRALERARQTHGPS
jgi:transcriptional regulator with XRE-family HTH domain